MVHRNGEGTHEFERTGWLNSGTKEGAQQYFDWFKYEFWHFVFVQQQMEKLAMTAIEFPPMAERRELLGRPAATGK